MDDEYDPYYDQDGLATTLTEQLSRETSVEPLTRDPADVESFIRVEYASWVSIRCAQHLDPDELRDPKLLEHWKTRAVDQGEHPDRLFEFGRRPYWVVNSGERVGTIGFAVKPGTMLPTIEVSSVFVRPKYRRQGWATRILRLLRDSAFEVGIKRVELGAAWGNQTALRCYLQQGMWVRSWKHSLKLYFASDKARLFAP
jgi:RimJ/RimL family protein N-acetyltransferase